MRINILQSSVAVNAGLALSQHIEIGTVDNSNGSHKLPKSTFKPTRSRLGFVNYLSFVNAIIGNPAYQSTFPTLYSGLSSNDGYINIANRTDTTGFFSTELNVPVGVSFYFCFPCYLSDADRAGDHCCVPHNLRAWQ